LYDGSYLPTFGRANSVTLNMRAEPVPEICTGR